MAESPRRRVRNVDTGLPSPMPDGWKASATHVEWMPDSATKARVVVDHCRLCCVVQLTCFAAWLCAVCRVRALPQVCLLCAKKFSWMRHRHHCRACGKVSID